MILEDPDEVLSLDQDEDLEPRVLEPEKHKELDLIMRVQDMPKGELSCPEFPHLILIENPSPEQNIASPSRVIASIMKWNPSEEEEKLIEDSKEAMRKIYDATCTLSDLRRAKRSDLIVYVLRLKAEGKESDKAIYDTETLHVISQ